MTQNNEVRDVLGTVAHMKKKGTLKYLLIALAVGAVLLILGSFFINDNDTDTKQDSEAEGTKLIGFFEYNTRNNYRRDTDKIRRQCHPSATSPSV